MIKEKLKNYNVILASGSPRRQQFLTELDLDFKIQIKKVNEIYSKKLKGKEITAFLAKLKANEFNNLENNDLIITSDTIVWFEGSALEKPKNDDEAIKMLQKLSNKKHKVYSSVCLKSKNKQVVFSDVTEVYIKKLTNEEIQYYVTKYNPLDKAGSYGIQEWFGLIAVKKIKGSFFNVMGFPVHKFYKEIMRF